MSEQVTDDFCSECDYLRLQIEDLKEQVSDLEGDVDDLEQDLRLEIGEEHDEALAEVSDILYGLYELAEERGASQEDLRMLKARLYLRSQGANL